MNCHLINRYLQSATARRAALGITFGVFLAIGFPANAEEAVGANSDGARCWMEAQKCQSACMDALGACRGALTAEDDGACDADFGTCAEGCEAMACGE